MPGFRLPLVSRVGPSIGVVEVEQNFAADLLNALSQSDRIIEILGHEGIKTAIIIIFHLGIHEEPQAEPIRALIAQDFNGVTRDAVFTTIHGTMGFVHGQ